jgi:hypothetical protein
VLIHHEPVLRNGMTAIVREAVRLKTMPVAADRYQ